MVLRSADAEADVNKEVHLRPLWSLLLTSCGLERQVDEQNGEVLWVQATSYPVQ